MTSYRKVCKVYLEVVLLLQSVGEEGTLRAHDRAVDVMDRVAAFDLHVAELAVGQ